MKTWEKYEDYALDFLYHQLGDSFEYHTKQKIFNPIRNDYMEVDGLIIDKNTNKKIILQCKYFKEKPTVELIEGFAFQCQSIGAKGIFITPKGYSESSKNIAKSIKNIDLLMFTKDQFEQYQYFDVFACYTMIDDNYCSYQISQSLKILIVHQNFEKTVDILNGIMFEEWLIFAHYLFKNYPKIATQFFTRIIFHHQDDGWRFNALEILDNYCCLSEDVSTELLEQDEDSDIIEWLEDWLSIN